ncbi:MAG: hypothetical protein ACRDP1_06295 [Nocardioidaceae bacterium]
MRAHRGLAWSLAGIAGVIIASVVVAAVASTGSRPQLAGDPVGPGAAPYGPTLFGTTLSATAGPSGVLPSSGVTSPASGAGIVRVFSAGPPPSWRSLNADTGRVPLVVSFKLPPQQVLSGADDTSLRRWFAAAPRNRAVFWAYFHEPEDQISAGAFTSEQFTKAWDHIARLAAQARNPALHSTVVLMCWSADPGSGRDWRSYVPRNPVPEVLAWDCYNSRARNGVYAQPSTLLSRTVEASRSIGAGWALAELGSMLAPGDDGNGRAGWLTYVAAWAASRGAAFVTYFDSTVGGDFTLSDPSSRHAWAAVMRR